jgi:rubredoxin
MSETRMVCRVCGGVFSEHEVRLREENPEEDEILCPNCGAAQVEPYPFDPEAPVEGLAEEGKEGV